MEYRQFAAPRDLAPWIECAWTLRGTLAPQGQTILPDGRMELVFHLGDPPAESGGSVQARAVITGQIRSAVTLARNGRMDAIGIRLRPEASSLLAPADQLTGRVHDLDCVIGPMGRAALESIGNARAPLETAFDSARTLMRHAPAPDHLVRASIEAIERLAGRGPMDTFLPDSIGVRQWERRFTRSTGLAPKAFARIARLREAIRLFESGDWPSWAGIALECGFYDQAHLANDFREFTGQSPERFFREGRVIADFYRDGFFQDSRREGR